jgi:hypothetical protein
VVDERAVVMDPSTPRGDGGAEGHPTDLKEGKWEEKGEGGGRGKGYRSPFKKGGRSHFCVGVKRANLCTSTQLSITEISTFCSKNSIFTTFYFLS